MKTAYDFKKLRRLITIYGVVQVVLIGLLIYMALNFQAGLLAEGRPQRFLHSVITSLIIQLSLFYPINKFAVRESTREIEACAAGLTPEELKKQRNSRMVGDVVKMSVFVFFFTFLYKMPNDKFFYSILFYTFILTFLSYFQCFNFSVRRQMREKG